MINRRQRLKIEAVKPPKQDAQQRIYNFNEVSQPYNAGNGHGASPALPVLRHAPCSKGCPLHNDIPAALFLLGRGDFIGAPSSSWKPTSSPTSADASAPRKGSARDRASWPNMWPYPAGLLL
jgi:glutamate synthase (NADPH) small chain